MINKSKWNDELIIKELKKIINEIGHFPTVIELDLINRFNLRHAIYKHGGINKFRKLLNYKYLRLPHNYWNDENIIKELQKIIIEIKYFPTIKYLEKIKRFDLSVAINRHGGLNKFRILLGYNFNKKLINLEKKPFKYWKDKTIIEEIKNIIEELKHFPKCSELEQMNRQNLLGAIHRNGGINKFRELLGYDVSLYEKYIFKSMSYIVKRGKNTENLVKQILQDYCILHNLPEPQYNKKLCKGNVIEFICNTNKTIGIDVTNVRSKNNIYKKWTHKEYYKYLNELWIVIFSNTFTEQDYIKLNNDSPSNVKVMSIYTFLKELDYFPDECLKNKINKYCSCTFHIKEELLEKK